MRPMMSQERRVPLNTTIDAATLAAIRSMQAKGESLGQVIDRLVAQRKVCAADLSQS